MSTDQPSHSAQRRQRRLVWVRRLRRGLPLAAAALVAVVGAQITWRALVVFNAKAPDITDDRVRMVNPSFSGEGRDGARYLVTARSGVRDANDTSRILLEQPTVTVSQKGATDGARSVAQRGVFREDDLTLRLEGDVRLARGGSEFVAKDAVIDTTTGRITGQGLQGQGAAGALRADTYALDGSGDQVKLQGGVRARISGR